MPTSSIFYITRGVQKLNIEFYFFIVKTIYERKGYRKVFSFSDYGKYTLPEYLFYT